MKSDTGEPPSHGKLTVLAESSDSSSSNPEVMLPTDPAWRPSNPLVSFQHATDGVTATFARERNFRFHVVATVLVMASAWLLSFSLARLLLLFAVIAMVLVAELLNTAIETTIDLVMPDRHPLAKRAKDAAAGAVLVAAGSAALVGLALFIPALQHTIGTLLRDGVNPIILFLIGGGFALVAGLALAWAWRDPSGKRDTAFSSADLSRKAIIGGVLVLFVTAGTYRIGSCFKHSVSGSVLAKPSSVRTIPALMPSAGVP